MHSRSTRARPGTGAFAGSVLVLLTVAALAFDVGMMLLERRDEQNAADAAALAGARYVFEPDCIARVDLFGGSSQGTSRRPRERIRRFRSE